MPCEPGWEEMRAPQQSHCLFCSLCCPVSLETGPGAELALRYGSGGLCGRGTSLVDLLQHPGRLSNALQRVDGRIEPLGLEEAGKVFGRLVDRALEEGPVALVADANLPCEDLAAIQHWARSRDGEAIAAVHFPPADLDLLDGLSAAPLISPEELDTCDGFVVVGDVFATHPLLGRPLLDAKYADPRAPFAAVDVHASTTYRFGNPGLKIAPGAHQAVLRLLGRARSGSEVDLRQLSEVADIDAEDARALAGQLQRVKKLGVVIAAELTKNADWQSVAALAGELARDGAVLPLFTCGNAAGAYRVARNLGMQRFAELVQMGGERPWAAVIEVGCDPRQTYPEDMLEALYGGAPCRIVLGCMRAPHLEAADLAVALQMPGECTGTAVDGGGEEKRLAPAVRPAPGAVGASDFFRLSTEGNGGGEVPWKEAPAPLSAPELEAAEIQLSTDGLAHLVAQTSAIHFDDGALSRRAGWTEHWQNEPSVSVAPELAGQLGVRSGARVVLEQNGRILPLPCRIDPSLDASVALVPVHFAAVRHFLPWRLEEGRLRCATPIVRISVATRRGGY